MSTRPMLPGRTAAALLALLLGAGTASAGAQETDDRWLPWMGCWEPVSETVGEAALETGETPAALVCFRPAAGDIGVEKISFAGDEVVARAVVRADGIPHEADLEGCEGHERGEFATRPGRVFLSSEHACDGGTVRRSSGLLTLVSPQQWVEIEVVTAGEESMTWVTRYRLASREDAEAVGLGAIARDRADAVRAARVAAAARPSVDEVIEAAERLDAEAVSAWLAERDARLDLDADELVRMADAGVPDAVIDMAVAMSFPERFAVDREPERYAGDRYRDPYGAFGPRGFGYPYYGSLFYSPFGRSFGHGFGFGGFHGPTIIRIDRDRDTGSRVIQGQGYRRGSGADATRSRAPSVRGSAVGTSPRSPASGSSTGRTARRRGGGGG